MESIEHRENGIMIIHPDGELDVNNSTTLKESIFSAMTQGGVRVVVDLGKVGYMDSAALGVLVSGLKKARERKAQFKLANVQEPVEKIFHLTRLTKFFDIHASTEDAIASFK